MKNFEHHLHYICQVRLLTGKSLLETVEAVSIHGLYKIGQKVDSGSKKVRRLLKVNLLLFMKGR